MAGVFVNYRTGDGHWAALLLYEALKKRFGAHLVFHASRSIMPGDDFAREIEQRLANIDVLLAIIGSDWLSASDESGRRLDDPSDWVRHEIRTALANETTVIPILIDMVDQLSESGLPDDIRALGRCQALRLHHEEGHDADVATLLDSLAQHVPAYLGEPWRVRLWDAAGVMCGAGVLLPDYRVLTCAQAVAWTNGGLTAELVGIAGRPRIPAHVVGADLVPPGEGNRGDVALLELAEPLMVRAGAILRRTGLSWDRPVYVCGFPVGRDTDVRLHATVTGIGGSTGEWLRITATSPDNQLTHPGLRGAGVVDAATHDVIGVLVGGDQDGNPAGDAWMIPTETIVSHIPRAGGRVTGGAAADEAFSKPLDPAADRSESTQQLTRWISRRDTGDRLRIVVGSRSEVYAVVASSSREQRTATPPVADRAAATLGSVDLALDASGKTPDDLARRVLSRAGIALADETRPVDLMPRVPPMMIIIDGVDLAAQPIAIVAEVVRPLLRRGCRLVLGFRDEASPSLTMIHGMQVVSLKHRLEWLTLALDDLETTEKDIMLLRTDVSDHEPVTADSAFLSALPETLRATAETEGEAADRTLRLLNKSEREIARLLRRAKRSRARLEQWRVERTDFRGMLEAYHDMANRNGLAEDIRCAEKYRTAHALLWRSPTDLPAAITAVGEYRDAIHRVLDGGRSAEERR